MWEKQQKHEYFQMKVFDCLKRKYFVHFRKLNFSAEIRNLFDVHSLDWFGLVLNAPFCLHRLDANSMKFSPKC